MITWRPIAMAAPVPDFLHAPLLLPQERPHATSIYQNEGFVHILALHGCSVAAPISGDGNVVDGVQWPQLFSSFSIFILFIT